MAREAMVTRTITTTKVNVLCLNVNTCEPHNVDLELAGSYKDEKALMKAVEKVITAPDEKPVHIAHSEVVETLYGLSEQAFISVANKLDDKRKPIAEVAETPANVETVA